MISKQIQNTQQNSKTISRIQNHQTIQIENEYNQIRKSVKQLYQYINQKVSSINNSSISPILELQMLTQQIKINDRNLKKKNFQHEQYEFMLQQNYITIIDQQIQKTKEQYKYLKTQVSKLKNQLQSPISYDSIKQKYQKQIYWLQRQILQRKKKNNNNLLIIDNNIQQNNKKFDQINNLNKRLKQIDSFGIIQSQQNEQMGMQFVKLSKKLSKMKKIMESLINKNIYTYNKIFSQIKVIQTNDIDIQRQINILNNMLINKLQQKKCLERLAFQPLIKYKQRKITRNLHGKVQNQLLVNKYLSLNKIIRPKKSNKREINQQLKFLSLEKEVNPQLKLYQKLLNFKKHPLNQKQIISNNYLQFCKKINQPKLTLQDQYSVQQLIY